MSPVYHIGELWIDSLECKYFGLTQQGANLPLQSLLSYLLSAALNVNGQVAYLRIDKVCDRFEWLVRREFE